MTTSSPSPDDYLALWWRGEIRAPEPQLIAWARQARLLPLLGWRAQTQGWQLPEMLQEAIRRRRREVTVSQALAHEQLKDLGRASAELGIPVVLVKGAAAAERYPASWMRPYGDIDLLVTDGESSQFLEALKIQGYGLPKDALGNRHVHLPPLQRAPQEPWVEIHTSLARIQGQALFSVEGWKDGLLPSPSYPGLYTPDPADHLLYLVFHGVVQHELERSVQVLTDLKFWTEGWEDADWAELTAKAKEAGLLRAVGLATALAAWFWDEPQADEISGRFPAPPAALLARSQTAIIAVDERRPLPHVWQHLANRNLTGTLAYLRLVLLGDPSQREWMSARERLGYLLRRPGTLLHNYGATLRRLVKRDPDLRTAWRTQRELQSWLRGG
jgi:hypothetical protein